MVWAASERSFDAGIAGDRGGEAAEFIKPGDLVDQQVEMLA
jgi:hypothetical protein